MPVPDGDWCGRGDGNNATQSAPMAALMRNNYRRATLHHFRLSKARVEIANEYLAPRRYVRKSHKIRKSPRIIGGLDQTPGLAWNRLSGPLPHLRCDRLKPAFAGDTHSMLPVAIKFK
jgi:hypothetical protein